MYIFSVETSCDETAVAVTRERIVLGEAIASQTDIHALYGGVVPEIAARQHIDALVPLATLALARAGITRAEIGAVAVTAAPGLIGALLTGLCFGKAVSRACNVPLIPVHHIRGHIAANYIAFPTLAPPFVCLVASGGHTLFLDVADYEDIRILGTTRDDAAGEAFDKIARLLGCPYPGGRSLDALACSAPDSGGFRWPKPYFPDAPLDCSFSGLKTAVVNHLHTLAQRAESFDRAALARSVNETVADMLTERLCAAAKMRGYRTAAISGGVAANSFLRARAEAACTADGITLYCPPPALCGDNAGMIGCAAYYAYRAGKTAALTQNAFAVMPVSAAFDEMKNR